VAVIAAAGLLVAFDPATGQAPVPAQPYPGQLTYKATPVPDRISLTWTGDPAHTQAVSWRSDPSVATPQAQIAEASGGPAFEASAVTVPATESTPVQSDVAFPALFHTVEFTDLEPETKYLYRVGDGANWSEWIEFTTASEDPEPFSFIYFGDAQNDIKEHWSRVIRRAYSDRPSASFLVQAGDLVNTSTSDVEWGQRYHAAGWIDGMIPSIATPGNHEYSGPLLSPYWQPQFAFPANGPTGEGALYEAMEETVYYVDYQGVRIVSLNSNSGAAAGDAASWWSIQAEWLDQVLASNPNKWTVITFHHPVFANNPSRDNKALRDAWRPIFEKHGVDLVLQGHDHSYARGNIAEGVSGAKKGVVYVVSVSGPKMYELSDKNWTDNGAEIKKSIGNTQLYQLIDVTEDALRYEARTAAGEPYDLFKIRKNGFRGPKAIVELKEHPAMHVHSDGEWHRH
jgi:hypothetical protein